MKSIRPIELVGPGFSEMTVDIDQMFAAILTAYITGNQRAAWLPMIPAERLLQWLGRTLEGKGPMTSFTPDTTKESAASPLGIGLTPEQKLLIGDLTADPRYEVNFGRYLHNFLTGAAESREENKTKRDPLLNPTYIVLPALGYPRPAYSLAHDWRWQASPEDAALIEAARPKQGENGEAMKRFMALNSSMRRRDTLFRLPAPGSGYSKGIAEILLMTFFPEWSSEIVPGLQTTGKLLGHDVRDKAMGGLIAMRKQFRVLATELWLHTLQAGLMRLHGLRRIHERLLPIAVLHFPGSRNAFDVWEETRQKLLKLPLHSLVTPVTSALQTGELLTDYGKRPAMWTVDECTDAADIALLNLFHEEVLTSVNEAVGVTWEAVNNAEHHLSLPQFAQAVFSSGLDSLFTEAARLLKWRSVNAVIGSIDLSGADFMLCDGDDFSGEPFQALLGLTPTLSLANRKLLGIGRRFESDFNTRGEMPVTTGVPTATEPSEPSIPFGLLGYTAIPLRGYLAEPTGGLKFERTFIPAGMSMGEEGTAMIASIGLRDATARKVVSHYASKQPGYVRENYLPVAPRKITDAHFTSWDAYAAADSAGMASTAYLAIYADYVVQPPALPGAGVAERQTPFMLLYSDRGFNMRIPVKCSRVQFAIHYTEQAEYFDRQSQQGYVAYDNDVTLLRPSTPLQQIVDLMPQGTTAITPTEPDIITQPGE